MTEPNPDPVEQVAPTVPVTPSPEPVDPHAAVLATITNPSGDPKYKSVDAALNSIQPKEDHINSLEAQVVEREAKVIELQEELAKRETTEEMVKKVMENRNTPEPTTPVAKEAEPINFDELVNTALSKREAAAIEAANREKVTNVLVEKYGDKASEILQAKVAELNIKPEFFSDIINQSATAALELLALDTPISSSSVRPQGTVNTGHFNQSPPAERKSIMTSPTRANMNKLWDEC